MASQPDTSFRLTLRRRYPARARGADHERSKTNAIHLHCLECMGGSRKQVGACDVVSCFFWPFRPYGERSRPEGVVPTEDEYDDLCAARVSPETSFRVGNRNGKPRGK